MESKTTKRPPAIHHAGRRPIKHEIGPIVTAAAENMHLTDYATRLLLCYANQANGFRPALRFISRETGIHVKTISRRRKELHEMGFILYSSDAILIDWNRIRLYSTLDPELTNKRRRNQEIMPACQPILLNRCIKNQYRKVQPRIPLPALNEYQQQFYDTVGNMTEAEWNTLLRGIGINLCENGAYITEENVSDLSEENKTIMELLEPDEVEDNSCEIENEAYITIYDQTA